MSVGMPDLLQSSTKHSIRHVAKPVCLAATCLPAHFLICVPSLVLGANKSSISDHNDIDQILACIHRRLLRSRGP